MSEYVGPIPETIHTDPTRLRQILINLVGNAIKFTDTGSVRLVARLVTGEEHGRSVQFDVIDTGIGMTQKETARLFQPFTQADTSTTRSSAARAWAWRSASGWPRCLGGDVIVAETAPGAGTRVRVTVGTGSLDGVRMLADPSEPVPATPRGRRPSRLIHEGPLRWLPHPAGRGRPRQPAADLPPAPARPGPR